MRAFSKRLHLGQWLGQDVEMFAGIKRHMCARHGGNLAGPETTGNHDLVGLDHMIPNRDPGNAPALFPQTGHGGVFKESERRASLAPLESASATSDGFTRPSAGDQTAPITSSTSIKGHKFLGTFGVHDIRFQPKSARLMTLGV